MTHHNMPPGSARKSALWGLRMDDKFAGAAHHDDPPGGATSADAHTLLDFFDNGQALA